MVLCVFHPRLFGTPLLAQKQTVEGRPRGSTSRHLAPQSFLVLSPPDFDFDPSNDFGRPNSARAEPASLRPFPSFPLHIFGLLPFCPRRSFLSRLSQPDPYGPESMCWLGAPYVTSPVLSSILFSPPKEAPSDPPSRMALSLRCSICGYLRNPTDPREEDPPKRTIPLLFFRFALSYHTSSSTRYSGSI